MMLNFLSSSASFGFCRQGSPQQNVHLLSILSAASPSGNFNHCRVLSHRIHIPAFRPSTSPLSMQFILIHQSLKIFLPYSSYALLFCYYLSYLSFYILTRCTSFPTWCLCLVNMYTIFPLLQCPTPHTTRIMPWYWYSTRLSSNLFASPHILHFV